MTLHGESANLLSVGAIDFGLVVDATVIMMENIFRHLSEPHAAARFERMTDRLARPRSLRICEGKFAVTIANSASPASQPAASCFPPCHHRRRLHSALHHERRGGSYFRTDGAHLCLCHCRRPDRDLHSVARAGQPCCCLNACGKPKLVVRWHAHVYQPVVKFALGQPRADAGRRGVVFVLACWLAQGLGSEFLPHLEEGNLWIRAFHAAVHLAGSRATPTSTACAGFIKSYPGSADRDFAAWPSR